MKHCYAVATIGLCLAFGVALPVRGMQSAAVVPAPLPLEFYGYAGTQGAAPQLAFLRQGARIFIAAEGDLIEDTYRLVRVGVDSAVVEEILSGRRQTLPRTVPKADNASVTAPAGPSVARPGNQSNAPVAAKASGPAEASAVPVGVDPANTLPRPYKRPVRQVVSTQ